MRQGRFAVELLDELRKLVSEGRELLSPKGDVPPTAETARRRDGELRFTVQPVRVGARRKLRKPLVLLGLRAVRVDRVHHEAALHGCRGAQA